jgi:sugar phosphate isomerase/epimerase
MKISCLAVTLFPQILKGEMDVLDYIRLMKSLHLDGFDLGMILLKNKTVKELYQISRHIEKESMPLIMVTTAPDFTHPDMCQRIIEMEHMIQNICVASDLGAQYVRIVAGQAHPGVSRKDGVEWSVNAFLKLVSIAESKNIKLVYEDHSKTAAWEHLDFSNPPEIFLEIAEKIKDTPIGINFDTANILVAGEERTIEVLDKVYDKVETIHVNDISVKGTMSPTLIGTGIVPIKEVFTYLKKRGFDGWLCIEEWGNQGTAGVAKAVDFTRKAWEEA